jgi:hypothetical protein
MAYTRAEDVQIDAWEALGNSGWNWEGLLPYFIKSEQFQTPAPFQVAAGITHNASYHGFAGPVKVGYPNSIVNGTIQKIINVTYFSIGQSWNDDVNGGKMHGITSAPETIDQTANVREDAATA